MSTTETPTPTAADARKQRTDDKARAAVAWIIDQVQTGAASPAGWRAPWHTRPSFLTPTNAETGNTYTGGNRFVLAAVAGTLPEGPNVWATYRQWQNVGAQVRRGETSPVAILRPRIKTDADPETGAERKRMFGFSAHQVFHASQVDGWTPPAVPAPPTGFDQETDDYYAAVARVVETVHHDEPAAYYSPSADRVTLPIRSRFLTADGYYATAAHEYAHATGAKHRLDRAEGMGNRFGSAAYAAEELVAELAAAITMATTGRSAEPRPDHAQYVASWHQLLTADPAALWTAGSKAEKAAAWIAETAARHLPDVQRARETFGTWHEYDDDASPLVLV